MMTTTLRVSSVMLLCLGLWTHTLLWQRPLRLGPAVDLRCLGKAACPRSALTPGGHLSVDMTGLLDRLRAVPDGPRAQQLADWAVYSALLYSNFSNEQIRRATAGMLPFHAEPAGTNPSSDSGRHVHLPDGAVWLFYNEADPAAPQTLARHVARAKLERVTPPQRFAVFSYRSRLLFGDLELRRGPDLKAGDAAWVPPQCLRTDDVRSLQRRGRPGGGSRGGGYRSGPRPSHHSESHSSGSYPSSSGGRGGGSAGSFFKFQMPSQASRASGGGGLFGGKLHSWFSSPFRPAPPRAMPASPLPHLSGASSLPPPPRLPFFQRHLLSPYAVWQEGAGGRGSISIKGAAGEAYSLHYEINEAGLQLKVTEKAPALPMTNRAGERVPTVSSSREAPPPLREVLRQLDRNQLPTAKDKLALLSKDPQQAAEAARHLRAHSTTEAAGDYVAARAGQVRGLSVADRIDLLKAEHRLHTHLALREAELQLQVLSMQQRMQLAEQTGKARIEVYAEDARPLQKFDWDTAPGASLSQVLKDPRYQWQRIETAPLGEFRPEQLSIDGQRHLRLMPVSDPVDLSVKAPAPAATPQESYASPWRPAHKPGDSYRVQVAPGARFCQDDDNDGWISDTELKACLCPDANKNGRFESSECLRCWLTPATP